MSEPKDGTVAGTPKSRCLAYQLDILKLELETINSIVDRMDTITQGTKNWAIVTWTAGVGWMVSQADMRQHVALTALLPLGFLAVDATWRRLQRRSTYRSAKISEFLNSEKLVQSFEQDQIVGFKVWDPIGLSHKTEEGYRRHIELRGVLAFREVHIIYLALVVVSLVLGAVLSG